ncbi:MAG: DUF6580 family putative transport protein [Patescibacteria group bacterium]
MRRDNPWLLVGMVTLFVVLAVVVRFVPHPYNFVPVGALALFCGTYIRSRWGVLIPVAVMAISDTIIGWHSLVLFTWGSYLLAGTVGWWVRRNRNLVGVVAGTAAGSVLFFVVTNFAVWAFTPLYTKTVAGLVQCFAMAIPFFRNTVAGDLFFVAAFFGAYAVARSLATVWPARHASAAHSA